MNKSTELNIIDYSSLKTMSKGGDYSCYENIVAALYNYVMCNNPNGFTKLDDASDYVTKPIYYDGTTVYTGDNAYAQFYAEHHTLSTINVKDSFSVDDAAGYYTLLENSNELLIKAIRKNGDIE